MTDREKKISSIVDGLMKVTFHTEEEGRNLLFETFSKFATDVEEETDKFWEKEASENSVVIENQHAYIEKLEKEVKELKQELFETIDFNKLNDPFDSELEKEAIDFANWVESSLEAGEWDRRNRIRFEPKMGGNPELPKRMKELYDLYKSLKQSSTDKKQNHEGN